MTTTKKTKRKAYHDRQVENGRVLVQTYLDRELRERLDLIARRRGVPLWRVWNEMVEDFCNGVERAEVAALRALFASDGVLTTHGGA